MYTWKSLIGQAYRNLDDLEGYDVFKIAPEGEKVFFSACSELEEMGYIDSDVFDEVLTHCNNSLTLSEIKGFMSGIYFALKMNKEYKEDFEKIEKFINSLNE